MSDANEPLVPRGSGTTLPGEQSGVETVRNESAAVAHTAADVAKDVGRTTKDEAASVVHEAKDQIQDLYEQTRTELAGEAAKQQERVAAGLQTIGDDLDSMARASQDGGLARELVRETSQRVGRVATWLNEREPGDVLDEVKSFARRQPGVFIGVAAIAGAVAGRLTRALASHAHDEHERSGGDAAGSARATAATPTTIPAGAHGTAAPGGRADERRARSVATPVTGAATPGAGAPGATPTPGTTGGEGWNDRPHAL